MTEKRKLAAILAADVVGYSRLAGADEEGTLARLRTLWSDLIARTISVHNGRVVKRTGDGSIIEFRSVVDAVRCAIEVQNGMVERNAGLPLERRIEFRVGIHLGDGEGQVVLLSGEAGIGKSRLTAALLEHLATEPHTRLRYFCSPQHTDSALYPIIGQMERAAEFAHGDNAQVKLDKFDALLAQTSTSSQEVALFAEMLSLPNDGRYPALGMTPEQRRQRTLEALGSQMEAWSRSNPVLMIFEDAHWADPTSLEAFSRVVDRLRTLCVLLIVTFRTEFEPPWIGRPHVTTVTVNRLAQRDKRALAVCVAVIAASVSASFASPCSQDIDRIQAMIDAKLEAQAAAGRSARESTAATLHRQPTPGSIAAAEVNLGDISPQKVQAVEALMARAREADRAGDQSACDQALAEVQRVFFQ